MLPYDAEVLFVFFAQYNRALWPFGLAAPLLAAAALVLALRAPGGGRIVAALLALGWAWVGWGWFLERFAQFNFLAPLYGWAFLLQAGLLAWSGVLKGRLAAGFAGGPAGWAGLALALVALVAWPLAGPLYGEGWAAAPLAGLLPGPTVLFTFGLLLLSRAPLHLAAVPLLWCGVAGFEGWALGLAPGLALAGLGLGAAALLADGRRRRPA